MRKQITAIIQAGLAILLLTTSGCSTLFPTDERPNILIIVTDDQRYDTMKYMPETVARIFDQGVAFTNGFVTTPLCCPSRSSILTGMYARNHGVRDNDKVLQANRDYSACSLGANPTV